MAAMLQGRGDDLVVLKQHMDLVLIRHEFSL